MTLLWAFCSVNFMRLYRSYVVSTEFIATKNTAVSYVVIFKNGRMVFKGLIPTDAILTVPTEPTMICIGAPIFKLLFRRVLVRSRSSSSYV